MFEPSYFHIDVPQTPKNVPQSIVVVRCLASILVSRFGEKDWLEIVSIKGSTWITTHRVFPKQKGLVFSDERNRNTYIRYAPWLMYQLGGQSD